MNSAAVGLLHKLLHYEQLLFRSVQTRRLKFHLFPATGTSNPNSLFKTRAGPVQLQFTDPPTPGTRWEPLWACSWRSQFLFGSIWFHGLGLLFWETAHLLFFISLPTRSSKCVLYWAAVNQACVFNDMAFVPMHGGVLKSKHVFALLQPNEENCLW